MGHPGSRPGRFVATVNVAWQLCRNGAVEVLRSAQDDSCSIRMTTREEGEGLDGQPRALSSFSGEGIRDRQASELLAVLKVFTVKGVALAFDCGCHDQRIVPGQAEPASDPQGLAIESG